MGALRVLVQLPIIREQTAFSLMLRALSLGIALLL